MEDRTSERERKMERKEYGMGEGKRSGAEDREGHKQFKAKQGAVARCKCPPLFRIVFVVRTICLTLYQVCQTNFGELSIQAMDSFG